MYQYGAFEEKGYRFESYVPDKDTDPVEFELRILINTAIVASFSIPMIYRPVFGMDIGDANTLERVADNILEVLPEPGAFNEDTKALLLEIVRRHHGSEWRERTIDTAGTRSSTFASTGADFRATIEPIFPNRAAAEAWLETARPELNGLSPEQALRRGMIREVIALVQERAKRGRE